SKGKTVLSGASGHRAGNSASDAIASCSARNHRMPVSPACCDNSQSRIASASCSAAAVVSTRKVMLAAQIREKFGGRLGASGFYIFVAMADSFDRFREVLPLPFEIRSQSIIKSGGRVLATPFGVLFQLRLTLRLEWDHIHGWRRFLQPIVRRSVAQV